MPQTDQQRPWHRRTYPLSRKLRCGVPASRSAVLVMASLLAVSGCRTANPPAGGAHAISRHVVTDRLGRRITISRAPQRIISLAPSASEILFAIGAGDQVVGVDSATNYPPAATRRPVVGDFLTPSVDRIIALRPDLILLGSATITRQSADDFQNRVRCPVFVFNPQTFADVLRDITTIGRLTGREVEARRVVAGMQRRLARIRARIHGAPRRTVFIEIGWDPLYTVGRHTFIDDLITIAGGTNIAAKSGEKYFTYNVETLVAENPYAYVLPSGGHGRSAPLASRPGFAQLAAMRSHRVCEIDPNIVMKPGPRLVDGAETLARFLHPDCFTHGTADATR